MLTSTTNTPLRLLRETARDLGKPQAVVAANWLRSPAMTTFKSGRGVTRSEFNRGFAVIRRLAAAGSAR